MARKFRILSIDGGGIRGIIATEILGALETILQRRTKNPQARIADYFDFFAGTSAGAISTALYLCPDPTDPKRPRYSAKEVGRFWLTSGPVIFNQSLWNEIRSIGGLANQRYPAGPIKKVLNSYLGRARLSQLVKPCLFTGYDIQERRARFFYRDAAKTGPANDFLARDVARASAAAPVFFEVAQIRSFSSRSYPIIDGGVFANNPSLCAYAEASKFRGHPTACDMLFLSLGAGQMMKPYSYDQTRHWGLLEWVRPLLDVFMCGVSETVAYQLRHIFQSECAAPQYLRLDPVLDKSCSPDLDNASPENIFRLQSAALRAVAENHADLERFAELLIRR